jgi:spore maturation protein CgeB
MLTIVYSFNKRGAEEEYWTREISEASDQEFQFVPFNHDPYLDYQEYLRAQLLDELYQRRDPRLMRMYADLKRTLEEKSADVLVVDNCFPYHPEFLRGLSVYKIQRTSDGPIAAYDRDFAYLHAYDHVLYHSPAYSPDLDMAEKLRYCGAKRFDFWPMAAFDVMLDPDCTEDELFSRNRDIDVIFVGALHRDKIPLLAQLKRALGPRLRLHGLTNWKRTAYFNVKGGFPSWVTPIATEEYGPLYRRAKIGINIHNRGDYTVGNYRLFDLPGNGVMQISDGGEYLDRFFRVGEEIIPHFGIDDLVDKVRYYLKNDEEREQISRSGYRRVMRDHRLAHRMKELGEIARAGLQRVGGVTVPIHD